MTHSTILAEVAKPPTIISSSDLTQDPATLGLEFEEKRKEVDEARRVRKEKADFVAAEIIGVQPQEQFFYGPFWRLCDYNNKQMFCVKRRTDPKARETNTESQWTCVRCSANSYALQGRYDAESMREARLVMGARIRVALRESRVDEINIREDITRWLMTLADSMIGNKCYRRGEAFMRAASHFGEARLPPSMAEELCRSKKMRQVNVTLERAYNEVTGNVEEYFRMRKDFGNVAYAEYFKQLLSTRGNRDKLMNDMFQWCTATAEKCGDVMEMWLGVLDICAMVFPQLNILAGAGCTDQTHVESIYNGLERSFLSFLGSTTYATTPNDKRKGGRDINPDEMERYHINEFLSRVDRSLVSMITKQEINNVRSVYEPQDVDMGEEKDEAAGVPGIVRKACQMGKVDQ